MARRPQFLSSNFAAPQARESLDLLAPVLAVLLIPRLDRKRGD